MPADLRSGSAIPGTVTPGSVTPAAALPGASLPGIRPREGFAFRGGQTAFLAKLADAFARGDRHHLGVFVPGYGKTITALAAFLVARAQGVAKRVVVFVPRGNLRDQYADGEALARLFQDLGAPPMTYCVADSARAFAKNPRTDLLVTTYQYASGKGGHAALKRYCDVAEADGGVLFVFDEVHHLSDDGTWARMISELSYSGSVSLSGTPMRSDNKTLFGVPFETRITERGDEERVYVALHEVTLRDAHAEGGILKQVEAHVVDYRLRMVREDTGETVELSLSGLREMAENSREVDAFLARKKLRFHDVYLDTLLRPAFARFADKRRRLAEAMRTRGRPEGSYDDHRLLVIAMSNAHSSAVLDYVRRTFPDVRAARIGQDLPAADCARDLDAFRAGRLDVMVQVDMIGEGTDIKPISVVVKADLVRAVSKTLQQVFRGMRYVGAWPESENVCDLYAAGDSDVVGVLEWITAEERMGMRTRKERAGREGAGVSAPTRSRWELAHVEHHRMQSHGLQMEATTAGGMALHVRERHAAPHAAAPAHALDVRAREQALRTACADLASDLVRTLAGAGKDVSAREVHARAKQVVGARQADLSLVQLEQKRRWLERCLTARRLL